MIETGIAKPEDVPDFGRKIHSEATRMIQLVNDILQLSKLDTVSETGDAPVMETVDLLEVAKECVERQKLNARRAYISLTYLGESAPVLGSRALLDELCQNLCDNAIRYNRPGGKVQIITTCNRDGHCSLTVTDNGIGIPREAQASVFERFYRVDKSRSKATGGTGLGLAIVKHIALIHGAQACALLAGRDYIVPEDVQHMAVQVLAHRLVLSPEARMKGVTPESVVRRIVQNTPVPVKL